MAKITLSIGDALRASLQEQDPELVASIDKYLAPRAWTDDEDSRLATEISKLLEDIVHSSDTDVGYFPCVLEGPEPGTPAFYDAIGIAPTARFKVGGYDNPKVEVLKEGEGEGKLPGFALISGLGKHLVENWHEYVPESEKVVLDEVTKKLASLGTMYSINLCADDGAYRILLIVAYREKGPAVGLFTLRVET
ncbi:hypothetical protein [Polyangium aurulentum]|uniref:hypothetical protein n=1 Tax=Polyangium aurulentum TaxID=2567896 RepID=UPI0010AE117A|nr:hypothetical protein [Polyangium aurulentum]UQA55969.1 hypothetical protein E8A73_032220 [Polyangium aurulentum]